MVSTPQAGRGLFSPIFKQPTKSDFSWFQPLKRDVASLASMKIASPGTALRFQPLKRDVASLALWQYRQWRLWLLVSTPQAGRGLFSHCKCHYCILLHPEFQPLKRDVASLAGQTLPGRLECLWFQPLKRDVASLASAMVI